MALLGELFARDVDTLRLYKPLRVADKFHQCRAHETGLSGSNRAGKTLAIGAEVAMAALGIHPVEGKYPKEKCRIACIGSDGRHLSTMYDILFAPGRMKVFKHPQTFKWHVVVEDDPEHQKFRDYWQESEPLIPERYVKEIAWEDRKERIPKSVLLHNGTRIRFYSGLVKKIPQGVSWHLCWIDEELLDVRRWLNECRARIADVDGYFLWSATPHNATPEFWDLKIKSEDPENETYPQSEQTAFFEMLNSDNPYISRAGMAAFGKKLKDDDEEYQIRFMGKFAKSDRSYPEFSEERHVRTPFKLRWGDTRYVIVDPGVHICGILFMACLEPPQEDEEYEEEELEIRSLDDAVVCYDELYIRQANSQIVAQAMREKLNDHKGWIQDFTIDKQGGRTIVTKEGGHLEKLYQQQMTALEIKARSSGWKYGLSDVKSGVEAVHKYLMGSLDDGQPRLFVFRNCKKLIWEFKAWKKKRNARGEYIGYEDTNNHLLDCLRYALTRPIEYVSAPDPAPVKPFGRDDVMKMIQKLKSGGVTFS